ncbi:hypothetical protein BGZ83_005825 [Gryganskiella cystojenkinii]|nr:hypothetical protein BGZ83_005825 [Gryganskiella cystojenkinii]
MCKKATKDDKFPSIAVTLKQIIRMHLLYDKSSFERLQAILKDTQWNLSVLMGEGAKQMTAHHCLGIAPIVRDQEFQQNPIVIDQKFQDKVFAAIKANSDADLNFSS